MTYELYLLGIAGVSIHYIKDWVNHNNKGLKYGWQKAIPTMLLSFITTLLVVYMRADIADLYVITPFSAIVLGYSNNSIFFSFVDAKMPTGIKDEETKP